MNTLLDTRQDLILVVDDDRDSRAILELLLTHEGYEVVTAGDCQLAVEVALGQPVDLILLDLRMPQLGGEAFCQAYRAGGGRAPVLIMSAADSTVVQAAAEGCGASACIPKPFQIESMLRTIDRHLGQRRPWNDDLAPNGPRPRA